MHGMCCHLPNTVRSWFNILNYLKALEYKVRKDCCVNNNNKTSKSYTGKEKPQGAWVKNYFKIKPLCKIMVLDFSSMIQLQMMCDCPQLK